MPSSFRVKSTPPSSLMPRFKAPSCPEASSASLTFIRNSSNSAIVRAFGFLAHYLSELNRSMQMKLHVTQRHIQKRFWTHGVPFGQPVAIEHNVFVDAYQAARSGRKKPRNRYAQEFQSRGSMRSRSGDRTPDKFAMIRVIFFSSMTTSPSEFTRHGLPQRLISPPVGSRKVSDVSSS